MGVELGFWTILIAHIMFCLSFVVTAVKARVMSMDPRLEQAAQDLYASPVQTFLRVTLPIAAPGIAAGALLSFALSFDDFIITNFNAGITVTFPMFVWGSAQRGTPVQINVIGTAMFAVAVLCVLAGQLAEPAARGPHAIGRRGVEPWPAGAMTVRLACARRRRTLPYWLDDPGTAPPRSPPWSATRAATCSSSAAATADCGPR